MAEGRVIKKRIAYSRRLASLKNDKARVLYFMMYPFADIEGRLEADPDIIATKIVGLFKWSEKTVQKCLIDLHDAGLITLYTIGNNQYLEFYNFKKMQRLDPEREAPSKIPSPPILSSTPENSGELQRTPENSSIKVKVKVKDKVKYKYNNNIATAKAVATFYTQIKNYFISAYKKKFNSEPAIDFGKDGRVVKKAEGLFKNIEDAYRLIDDFLESKKAEECGYTLSVCFSTHTINLWKAGKLLNLSEDELFEKFSKKKQ